MCELCGRLNGFKRDRGGRLSGPTKARETLLEDIGVELAKPDLGERRRSHLMALVDRLVGEELRPEDVELNAAWEGERRG